MSEAYRIWVNENCGPDDYDEPENRCTCGAFIPKSPAVTKSQDANGFTVETVSIDCKRCGRADFYEQNLVTPWGTVEVDLLRDAEGDWMTDPTEIEATIRRARPWLHKSGEGSAV
jgi:predicted nucleic-acid-binding Zn-ribbon protein